MKLSYPYCRACFTFALFLVMAFALGGCKKESNKDCGCGSTVVASISNQSGLLYRSSNPDGKIVWTIYVIQPEASIPRYTGIICNTKEIDELITKEGLENKAESRNMEPFAIVFSGDLFDRCVVKDDNIIEFAANYSFNVRLDSLSLDPAD